MTFLAERMRALVEDIQSSAAERAETLSDVRTEVELLRDEAQALMRRASDERGRAAAETRSALAADRRRRSEETRAALRAATHARADMKARLAKQLAEARADRSDKLEAHLTEFRDAHQQFAADLRMASKTWQSLARR